MLLGSENGCWITTAAKLHNFFFTPTPPRPQWHTWTQQQTHTFGGVPLPFPTPHHEKSVRLPFFGFSKIVVNGDYTSAKAYACECVGRVRRKRKKERRKIALQ